MDWQRIASYLEKLIPIALISGLFADWLRLRFARRAEERKHIARAISDLLEMRSSLLILPELPKHLPELVPNELRNQIPPDVWRCINFGAFFSTDAGFADRYRKAVCEIAGFRPLLAYQLSGKERYFELRNILSHHFSQSPGSPIVAILITEVVDRECIAPFEETLSLLAKAHGIKMRFSIWRTLRRRRFDEDLVPSTVRRVLHQQIRQIVETANTQTTDRSKSAEPLNDYSI